MGLFNAINGDNSFSKKLVEEENKVELVVEGITEEEVIKELKQILKAYKPICIGVAYDIEDEETEEFIEFNPNKNQVYLVKECNPYVNNYDLEEDGEIVSLPKLKEIIAEVAKLTLAKNLEKEEVLNWLNDYGN